MLNRSWIDVPELKINQKIKNILSRWSFFIFIIICWIIILIKASFFKSEQRISQVKFSESTLATYQDIELFNLISDEVKGKNYFLLVSKKDELLAKIQKSFPFVWKIELQLEQKSEQNDTSKNSNEIIIWLQFPLELPITTVQESLWTFPLKESKSNEENWWILWVQLQYYDPLILIKLNDKTFAVRDENTNVELKEWMLLWIRDYDQEPLFTIETPQYLSWTTNLDWFFFELSLDKFLEITSLAKETFPNMLRFVYLAWSTRIAIFTPDYKTLYFNFPEWIPISEQWDSQINKYNMIKEKYHNFDWVEIIDLWALEENKTIIRKY